MDIINGSLGVGLNNPGLKLHIQDGALPSAPAPNSNCDVVLEGETNTGIQFLSGNQTQLRFGDADSTAAGSIIYKHTDDNFRLNFSNSGYLSLNDGGGENLRFTPNNEIGIAGANYGTSGQVLTSGGAGAAVQWADAGGGAWEVLSHQNFATTNASFSENKGWTTNYQTVKCCFSMIRRQSTNTDMWMRWYMDTSYGNNGTLKTATEYKYGSRYRSWNTDNYSGSNGDSNAWKFFNGNGGQYWSGEITFRIGTGNPTYNFTKYAWGFVERTDNYGNESCRYDNDTNMVIVGAQLYNPANDNWTEGTCTWLGLKGQ